MRHNLTSLLCASRCTRCGYTMMELLVATVLSVTVLFVVVTVFAGISGTVTEARAVLETADRLRAVKLLLQEDLAGITVRLNPPCKPESNEGYFQYIEGPVGPLRPVVDVQNPPNSLAMNFEANLADASVIDTDDILIFTTKREDRPFVGRCVRGDNGEPIVAESHVAEVAWFVRGRTLYRRVLLVAPHLPPGTTGDIAARFSGNTWVPCTLADLTKPEFRFPDRHQVVSFPYDESALRQLGLNLPVYSGEVWGLLGLPFVRPGDPLIQVGALLPLPSVWDSTLKLDYWNRQHVVGTQPAAPGLVPSTQKLTVDSITDTAAPVENPTLANESVVLTNVIGFDVKVWDPDAPIIMLGTTQPGPVVYPGDAAYRAALQALASGQAQVIGRGAYVDLDYTGVPVQSPATLPQLSAFSHPGQLHPNAPPVLYYDTWTTHYEHDGLDQWGDGVIDPGSNGFDDDGNGIVDDLSEWETRPPYPVPLRGIKVTIRVFEPDTKTIRQVTIVHDFGEK